ncbi:hypothetical protein QBC32DRAFT_116761 [Pseudoneurospora amorphoporcata]|uniref:Uncharacterized protein n=1 Tax=Pseudoneurospora amorphoporcata TaxID=241081 RepID=A0AAN6NJA5_9PEZI|nr:hypothetical protein QBC32DRAFT_116761 [Pseudoneurospora amorphoporcata]
MSSEGDVLLIFDFHRSISLIGGTEEEDQMLVQPGLTSSPSIKQLLGACVPLPGTETSSSKTATQMTQALCRILDSAHVRGDGKVSVQRLCSFMKEELRQDGTGLEQRVFVTQLGGRHLLDIELPVLSVGGGIDVGGDLLPRVTARGQIPS